MAARRSKSAAAAPAASTAAAAPAGVAMDDAEQLSLLLAAEWLMTSWRSGLPQHQGTLLTTGSSGKTRKTNFFRAKRALVALTSEAYKTARERGPAMLDRVLEFVNTYGKRVRTRADAPKMPKIDNVADARIVLRRMLSKGFIVRVERFKKPGATDEQQKLLQPSPIRSGAIEEDDYYAWLWDEPPRWATLIAFGILIVVFVILLFPMWPWPVRWAVSWLLMILAGLLLVLLLVRPLIWLVSSFIVPPGLWILPNINEEVGFFDAFKPLWCLGTWEHPDPSRKKKAKAAASTSAPAPVVKEENTDHDADDEHGDSDDAPQSPNTAQNE